jgi:cytochrome c oxidase subunit 3
MLTGFHGFHVMLGLLILLVSWVRFSINHFNRVSHRNLLLGSWYWHFVDVVWLFLFTFVYYFYKRTV